MSGLFRRLAQQAVGNHHTSVEPARMPVFPVEATINTGASGAPYDVGSMTANYAADSAVVDNRDRTGRPISPLDSEKNHTPASSPSRHLQSNQADEKVGNTDSQAAIRTPDGNEVPTGATVHRQVRHSNTADKLRSAEQPEDRQKKPVRQNPNHYVNQDSKSEGQSTPATLPAVPSLYPARGSERRPGVVLPLSDTSSRGHMLPVRSEVQTGRTARQVLDQATAEPPITIIIGQIDIKATPSEDRRPATKPRSTRKPTFTLEQYQQRRQRGEA